jgi:hypothetical protein
MPRSASWRTLLLLAALVLAFAAGFAVEALELFPTPIGCAADGFCNSSCLSDPDCGGGNVCQHGKPCTTDADCGDMGDCAVWRQCVCFG